MDALGPEEIHIHKPKLVLVISLIVMYATV